MSRSRVTAARRWRLRLTATLAMGAVIAVVIAILLATRSPSTANGSGSRNQASGSATVQRRDLVQTDTESGTLSYAKAQTVYNRLGGTITSLPSIGQVVKPGQILYEVDNSPVVLFDGATPPYRDLSAAVSRGPDVEQLNRNLIELGFADGEVADSNTWQSGTTAAVERWQASLGETQTGTITLGQVVFLPGPQRITAVDAIIGSTAGSGSGSGSSASVLVTPRPEFASLTTAPTTPSVSDQCPSRGGSAKTTTTPTTPTPGCKPPKKRKSTRKRSSMQAQLKALEALLKAETAELQKENRSGGGTGSGPGGAGGSGTPSGAPSAGSSGSGRGGSGGSGGGGSGGSNGSNGSNGSGGSNGSNGSGGSNNSGGSGGSGGGGSGGSGASDGSGSGGGAGAQAILETSSTQLVATVDLDATKQSEAKVGEKVTVELPNDSTVNGKVTAVSPVAQSSSGSGNGNGNGGGNGNGQGNGGGNGGGNNGSGSSGATIPVTITLGGRKPGAGLDQAAVSVNFVQQVANNVLSVPVTALLATAGGGYNIQEAGPPHALIPVAVGLFAAGYVQISGPDIHPGLVVTDSQG